MCTAVVVEVRNENVECRKRRTMHGGGVTDGCCVSRVSARYEVGFLESNIADGVYIVLKWPCMNIPA